LYFTYRLVAVIDAPLYTRAATLRRLWLNVHLWIGVSLAALLIPISISGAHDEIDAVLNPHRYAVTGTRAALPPTVYLSKAAEAVAHDPASLRASLLRYPEQGSPVRVVMRAQSREQGTRPKIVTVFMDPPTAAVLDVMEFRSSFFGFLHVFHENLTIPEYSGRQIVGWAGIGMLIMSLTGLWLWWPRGSGFLRGLRWTRSTRFTFNLHHLLGFWLSVPLAVVSFTGIYFAFPQTSRNVMSSMAAMNPQPPRGGQIAQHPALTADHALAIALKATPNAEPVALFLPMQQRGEPGLSWRVQMAVRGEPFNALVDDRKGEATVIAPQPGDRAASWIRWIHEGSHSGPVWAIVVFLTGVFPTVFAVTGIVMWLRKRADRRALNTGRASTSLRPAE
jgi:uncharacterized iron-regulated membrane protein